MYDGLYETLATFEKTAGVHVEVAHHAPHPELNAHLASVGHVPYDLVSTHTKYAPSQLSFLAPLDEYADQLDTDRFYTPLIDLAKIVGRLYGIPRNIDVKLLHYRTDLVDYAPADWNVLIETARRLSTGAGTYGFVFPGMESGLFGMFYELAEMGGASLFPESNIPLLNNQGGRWALETIRELYRSGAVPAKITGWHYDESHRCFRDGHAAMVCDWPGYYGAYRDGTISRVSRTLRLARMPAGPTGIHKAYAGSHTFALTRRGSGRTDAVALLRFLTSPEQQLTEARRGSVPTRPAVLAEVTSVADAAEAERWKLLDQVIATDMLIPPGIAYYPEIEEILWHTVRSAMVGMMSIAAALETIEVRITECHNRYARRADE
jgi:multiple sugar transport system substrate-binding protein